MNEQSVLLHSTWNGSDKVYHIDLREVPGGWVVNYRNGRRCGGSGYRIRGNAGGTRTRSPRPYDSALRIYRNLIREKQAGHYLVVEQSNGNGSSGGSGDAAQQEEEQKNSGRRPMLLSSIDEETKALQLCGNPSYCAQKQEIGKRRMLLKPVTEKGRGIKKTGDFVGLPQSICNAAGLLRSSSFLMDGEQVDESLRVWDLLEENGEDLREQSMQIRYERLGVLIPSYYNLAIQTVPTAFTRAAKLQMFHEIKEQRGEGIVFKLVAAPYVEGTTKYALKYEFRSTAVIQVVGTTPGNRSIQMGALSEGGIRFIGNLTISPDRELPSLGDLVLVEYLHVLPDSGVLVRPAYLGPCDDKREADRFDLLKVKTLEPEGDDETVKVA